MAVGRERLVAGVSRESRVVNLEDVECLPFRFTVVPANSPVGPTSRLPSPSSSLHHARFNCLVIICVPRCFGTQKKNGPVWNSPTWFLEVAAIPKMTLASNYLPASSPGRGVVIFKALVLNGAAEQIWLNRKSSGREGKVEDGGEGHHLLRRPTSIEPVKLEGDDVRQKRKNVPMSERYIEVVISRLRMFWLFLAIVAKSSPLSGRPRVENRDREGGKGEYSYLVNGGPRPARDDGVARLAGRPRASFDVVGGFGSGGQRARRQRPSPSPLASGALSPSPTGKISFFRRGVEEERDDVKSVRLDGPVLDMERARWRRGGGVGSRARKSQKGLRLRDEGWPVPSTWPLTHHLTSHVSPAEKERDVKNDVCQVWLEDPRADAPVTGPPRQCGRVSQATSPAISLQIHQPPATSRQQLRHALRLQLSLRVKG
ncbi:hypothetical protein BDK51DRAFT_30716 [Blyttiomyces helicus]|uniref:Uncharacterized protein n=1 Tax=Blyttiomyces helicus TaxID=388810 RepID=A0A4P9WME8_9FUNG|nr:hypothetical protein BDK51DRAFT_30716 [Blyttiomyces helicus]|eukprot:RKO93652.1 hypothetical protein BDK51DRAFT_30716 [Blyttiomyces helicus]